MNEFSLIEHFFQSLPIQRNDVLFGIGDDAAGLSVPPDMELLVSTDTLVSGVHFLPEWSAYDIAFKSVMVNISDMAAMAAQPCWLTLALTIPNVNQNWLSAFSEGLREALARFHVDLIGGDTTQGPLSITLTILGLSPLGQSIRRLGARPGDLIMITGELGAAALAVHCLYDQSISEAHRSQLMEKLLRPVPRVDYIPFLRQYATSAIDISDGLGADLNHICVASGVGAILTQEALPVHPLLSSYLKEEAVDLALAGGDDYELCFTVSPDCLNHFLNDLKQSGLNCYQVGVIDQNSGIRMMTSDSQCRPYEPRGYSHF